MAVTDIIIFGGQSNMQGQSECLSENCPVAGAYEYKWLSDTLVPLQNPVGEDVRYDGSAGRRFMHGSDPGAWLSEHVLGSACYGHTNLIPSFCRAYLAAAKTEAVAVPVAKGSTVIADWLPGTPGYEAIVKKSLAAVRKVEEQGKIGRIYFVWLQGESDAIFSCSKSDYKQRLTLLAESLARDVHIDAFGVIRVGRFVGDQRDDEIIRAQLETCAEHPLFVLLSTLADQLEKTPSCMNPHVGGHFGAKGLEMLGADAGSTLGVYRSK